MSDPTALVSAHKSYEADVNRTDRIIKSSEALVPLALSAVNRSTGLLEFADDADDLVPAGVVIGSYDGIESHLTGDGSTYKAQNRGGIILTGSDGISGVSVTGASAITDFGKLVYATDGQTLTLTRPTTGVPYGFVFKWVSSTYCWVYVFSVVEAVKLGYAQLGCLKRKSLGVYTTNVLLGTGAVNLYTETLTEHLLFKSFHCLPTGYDNACVAGSQVLSIALDGTEMTTSAPADVALTLAYTSFDAESDLGTVINSTTIAAGNEGHIGDVLTVPKVASGTPFTADLPISFELFAIVEVLPGA